MVILIAKSVWVSDYVISESGLMLFPNFSDAVLEKIFFFYIGEKILLLKIAIYI